jgi:beta-lactamase regulating signal transducer with metallopeptidase domain
MEWIAAIDWIESWLWTMVRVSAYGGLAVAVTWCICRSLPRMSPTARSWIWRCVYLKLILLMLWQGAIPVPLFPNPGVRIERFQAPRSVVATRLESRPSARDSSLGSTRSITAESKPSNARLAAIVLFALWLAGVLFITLRTVRSVLAIRRALRDSHPLTYAWVRQECEALSRGLRLKRSPRLLAHENVSSPEAVGFLRPVLFFPSSFVDQYSPGEVRSVLAHELAHLRRFDLLWGCLRHLVNGLLFFHPLVWLAQEQAVLAEEMACDETAIRGLNATISDYAGTLLKVTEQSQSTHRSSAALLGTGMSRAYRAMARRLQALQQIRDLYSRLTRGRRRRATFLACLAALALMPLGLMNWFHSSGIRQIDPRYPVLGFKVSRGRSHTLAVKREICRFAGFTLSRAFEDSVPTQRTRPGASGARSSAGWTNDTKVAGTTIPGRVAGLLRKLGLKPQLDVGAYSSEVYLPEDSWVVSVRFAYDPKYDHYEDIGAVLEDERRATVVLAPYRSEYPPQSGEYVKFWVVNPAPMTQEKFTLHLRLTAEDKDIAVVRLAGL